MGSFVHQIYKDHQNIWKQNMISIMIPGGNYDFGEDKSNPETHPQLKNVPRLPQ